MVVSTSVAPDPGLLFLLPATPAWKTPAPRSPLPKLQSNWMLPGGHELPAFSFVIHPRVFAIDHLPDGLRVPVFPRCVFRAESPIGGR
jgi:hypothetical protein